MRAASLYRTLTAALLREAARDPRFRTVLAISPDHAVHARFAAWNALVPPPRRPPHSVSLPANTPWRACNSSDRMSKEMRLGRRNAASPSPLPHPLADATTQSGKLAKASLRERAGVRGSWRRSSRFGVRRDLARIKQGVGDLGCRMQRVFDGQGNGPLIIVGTDIPFITRTTIASAFRRLASAGAIIGPAEDGGYWLIGLRRRPKCLRPFENVRWSTAYARSDTLKNLAACRVAQAETLFDIDSAGDYRRYMRERYR